MTTKEKNEMQARCELAMMGLVVACNDDEVQFMTDYICNTLGTQLFPFIHGRIQPYSDNKVTHIVCNKVYGMPCITYLLETPYAPKPFEEDYGSGYPCAFCYVLNLVDPDFCSEFGDCFFEKRGNFYHRVS